MSEHTLNESAINLSSIINEILSSIDTVAQESKNNTTSLVYSMPNIDSLITTGAYSPAPPNTITYYHTYGDGKTAKFNYLVTRYNDPTTSLVKFKDFKALSNGEIVGFDFDMHLAMVAGSNSNLELQVSINGMAAQTLATLTNGDSSAEKTGLSIAFSEGDILTFNIKLNIPTGESITVSYAGDSSTGDGGFSLGVVIKYD